PAGDEGPEDRALDLGHRLEAERRGVELGQGEVVAAHEADHLGVRWGGGGVGHGPKLRTERFVRVSGFNTLLKRATALPMSAPPWDHAPMADETTPERDYSLFGDDHIATYRETNGEV